MDRTTIAYTFKQYFWSISFVKFIQIHIDYPSAKRNKETQIAKT